MHHDNDNIIHPALRFLSVCSGIEAASVAFKPLGWEAVAFSEIEPAPCSVLAHHYPHVPNHGDMTKFKEWPHYGKDGSKPINLVCGGTPCQAFSVAGLRDGLNDPRGNLSLTFLAIVDKYQPEWVLFENVPGILSSACNNGPGPSEPEIDLDAGNGPEDGEEVVVDDEFEADESHAFSCFLAGLQELGYGVAYRVIDAQYVRVDGFAGAVPQRRRRVFVVGYLGDFRRAAAVLLEPESLSGNPAPSRKAGQGTSAPVAPCLVSSGRGSERTGDTRGQDPVVAVTFDRQSSGEYGTDPIASTVSARDYKSPSDLVVSADVADTMVSNGDAHSGFPEAAGLVASAVAPAITQNPYGDNESREGLLVAHSLTANGFDASEDGTGRGPTVCPVPYTLAIRGRGDTHNLEWRQDGTANAILTPNGGRAGIGVGAIAAPLAIGFGWQNSSSQGDSVSDEISPTLDKSKAPAVAHAIQAGALRENPSSGPDGVGVQEGVAYTLEARAEVQAVQTEWAVRRLTPVECARLQGFPDDYLSQVIHNGKPLADGPMYKGLGNSWPVNSVRWIGRRIQMVEEIAKELEAANDNYQSTPITTKASHA